MYKRQVPIHQENWPSYDADNLEGNELTIAIQINGKLRGEVLIEKSCSEQEIIDASKALKNVKKYLDKEKIKKTIYVPKKLINFVV